MGLGSIINSGADLLMQGPAAPKNRALSGAIFLLKAVAVQRSYVVYKLSLSQ